MPWAATIPSWAFSSMLNCPSAPCHREAQKRRGTSLLINALHRCCKPTAGTYAIGTEWNRDGSSCLYTQVSSKPSRICRVRATCSTSAADLYHMWKHKVPTAIAAPGLCPATPRSASFTPLCLCHPTHLCRAVPFSWEKWGAGSARGSQAPPLLLQLLTPPMTKQAPEQSCQA